MFESWGRCPKVSQQVVPLAWRSDALPPRSGPVLAVGQGRSYGDVCLNDGGVVLTTGRLDRFIAFDERTGVVRCEAGLTIADLISFALPRGFFVPVVPGTQMVSIGGAIANDIHGKNHVRAGTFGKHVRWLELLRSDGERVECRPGDPLFAATVAGLGLTGLITAAEIQLAQVAGPYIVEQTIPFRTLDEFFDIDAASQEFEHSVAWVDAFSREGRGIYYRGDHSQRPGRAEPRRRPRDVPVDFPPFALSGAAVRVFNQLVALKGRLAKRQRETDVRSFFFPLDRIGRWNRIYGERGLFQFQCVVPTREIVRDLLGRVRASGQGSFLTVLKTFGDVPSPGLLSFPRPGITVTFDFANRGADTLRLLGELEDVVRAASGALYPAKDATMTPRTFAASFKRLGEFQQFVDPGFSSSFWRRVARA
ncbi:MAG: FAD-dependent oxidoreductase [Myxococcales bacterium]